MKRTFFLGLSALSILLSLAGAAYAADGVPNLHVEKLCRGIASQSSDPMAQNYPVISFDRCMQAEQEDREQLIKEWFTFSSDDKRHCVAEVTMGGESSYTELITCLEMARDVRSLLHPTLRQP